MILVCLRAIFGEGLEQNIPPGLSLAVVRAVGKLGQEVSLGRLQAGMGDGALMVWVPAGLAMPTALLWHCAELQNMPQGCALGIQLVSPSVLPGQGCKTL